MQVNYKTISAMEFDVLTGTYKQVDKQVEDTSGAFTDNAFFELLMGANDGQGQGDSGYTSNADTAFDMSAPLKDSFSAEPLDDSANSNLYALRFRQNDSLRTMELGQNGAEQLKNNLFSDLLAAL